MSHSLYKSLILPLRQADEAVGRELLKRYLIGPQTIHDQTEADILLLLDQLDPRLTREDLLQYLKDIVGFTPELASITDRLTTDQLRRLIKVAVPLWNQRHTARGVINAIRFFTGRPVTLHDWFYFRWLIGETMLGEDQLVTGGDSWIIGGVTSPMNQL